MLPSAWRLPVIFWACISEFLDGYLARRWKAESELGQALDPIADKVFVFAVIAVLIIEQKLSWLQFSLIAMRDIIVAVGTIIITLEHGDGSIRTLKPRWSGKVATAFQFAFLLSLFIFSESQQALFVTTALVSCASAIDYLHAILERKFSGHHPV